LAVARLSFRRDHPAAQGHFPGNPVIPAAVLLGEALRAVEAGLGVSLPFSRIRSAKFFAPVRPGDRVVVEYYRSGSDIRFACAVEGKAVAKGDVACDATLAAT
jgi:3-hydroxyacyl-[acyl-carrier-protein] dehydratase